MYIHHSINIEIEEPNSSVFSVTFTLYCTMMPRFSFCVGSCISVLEARLVSSCFSWPSSAAVRGWYQLIDLPTEWPPYLDPTYLCYWREEASTRTLYSGWTQSRGGTHPQTPLKAQIELISHCSLQKLVSISIYLLVDCAFVLGSGEQTDVCKLSHRYFYLLYSFVGVILKREHMEHGI